MPSKSKLMKPSVFEYSNNIINLEYRYILISLTDLMDIEHISSNRRLFFSFYTEWSNKKKHFHSKITNETFSCFKSLIISERLGTYPFYDYDYIQSFLEGYYSFIIEGYSPRKCDLELYIDFIKFLKEEVSQYDDVFSFLYN